MIEFLTDDFISRMSVYNDQAVSSFCHFTRATARPSDDAHFPPLFRMNRERYFLVFHDILPARVCSFLDEWHD